MKRVKHILLCICLVLGIMVDAQILPSSYIKHFPNFTSENTIVRNYAPDLDVVVTSNPVLLSSPFVTETFGHSSIFIKNATSSLITLLADLPDGYFVNDVRFVSLKTENLTNTIDFCCICGTRYFQGENNNLYYYDSTSGFVGFFSMSEAIYNPNNPNFTIKLRNIEMSQQLFKMTCYAEYEGQYHHLQHAFKDNAVVDVIGIPSDTSIWKSSLWRVKFYPDYPNWNNGTRWDNNIRFPITERREILTDIIGTQNKIITASRLAGNDSVIWLRSNVKETHLHNGGMELSDEVWAIDLNNISVPFLSNMAPFSYRHDKNIRLCPMTYERFSLSFYCDELRYNEETTRGVFLSKFDASTQNVSLIDAMFNSGNSSICDVGYLTESDHSTLLYKKHNQYYLSAHNWVENYGIHIGEIFILDTIVANTMSSYSLNNFDNIIVGCNYQTSRKLCTVFQKFIQNLGSVSCLEKSRLSDPKTIIELRPINRRFIIAHRFLDIAEQYPVTLVPFNPFLSTSIRDCELE